MPNNSKKEIGSIGAIPILVLVAALGILGFLLISNTFEFKDKLFGRLFPKPASKAEAMPMPQPRNCPAPGYTQLSNTEGTIVLSESRGVVVLDDGVETNLPAVTCSQGICTWRIGTGQCASHKGSVHLYTGARLAIEGGGYLTVDATDPGAPMTFVSGYNRPYNPPTDTSTIPPVISVVGTVEKRSAIISPVLPGGRIVDIVLGNSGTTRFENAEMCCEIVGLPDYDSINTPSPTASILLENTIGPGVVASYGLIDTTVRNSNSGFQIYDPNVTNLKVYPEVIANYTYTPAGGKPLTILNSTSDHFEINSQSTASVTNSNGLYILLSSKNCNEGTQNNPKVLPPVGQPYSGSFTFCDDTYPTNMSLSNANFWTFGFYPARSRPGVSKYYLHGQIDELYIPARVEVHLLPHPVTGAPSVNTPDFTTIETGGLLVIKKGEIRQETLLHTFRNFGGEFRATDTRIDVPMFLRSGKNELIRSTFGPNHSIAGPTVATSANYVVIYTCGQPGHVPSNTSGEISVDNTVYPWCGESVVADTVIISNISSSTTASSATITWTTNIPSTSRVSYGTTSSLDTSTTEDTNLTTNHQVGITGLANRTRYYFKVHSKNSGGLETNSITQHFRTKNR